MTRRVWPLFVVLVLLATLLASRWLTYDLPYVDEWWSIFKSGGDIYGPLSPQGIWERIVTMDPGGMGAGYYLALAAWEALAGSTLFAVRALSLLTGLLAIAMTYRIGADWFSRRVGIIAAALMASSASFVNFMHEGRAYTLVALTACCVIYTYWRIVAIARPNFRHYAALTLALTALAYSHYVALSVAVVIGLHHVFSFRNNRRWILTSAAMIVAALAYVPWLPVLAEVARRGAGDLNRQATSMTAGQAVETLAQAFSNGSPALLVLLLALGSGLLVYTYRHSALLFLWLFAGLGAALVVNASVPFLVHLRYLIFLWPALAIACALGIEALARRGVPLSVILGVWLIFGVARSASTDFTRDLFGEIYRAPAAGVNRAIKLLDDLVTPDDLVLFHIEQPGFENFGLFIEDYLTRNLPDGTAHAQTEFMNNSGAQTDAEYRADVQAILAGHQRVWIVDVPEIAETQRTRTLTDTLSETHADCGTALVRDDATLRLYVVQPDLQALREHPQHQYGDEETGFARMTVLPNATLDNRFGLTQKEAISLTLGWAATGRLRGGTHSVAVHVVDQNGVLVTQDDYPLPTEPYGCHVSVLPARLPDGSYTIYASVYNWQTLESLPVAGYPDGRIPVAYFLVNRGGE